MKMKFARLAAMALAPLAATVVLPAPALAQAQFEPGTDGRNVRSVSFPGGRYVMVGDGRWHELNSRGDVTFRFRESSRDQWSVYLSDETRPVEIQLDLHRRKVLVAENRSPRRDLYNIIGASVRSYTGSGGDRFDDNRGGGRGPGGPGPGGPRGESFNILAGPLWNQRDAEQKCRSLAYRAGGEWTGQWSTVVQGRESVCEIRLRR